MSSERTANDMGLSAVQCGVNFAANVGHRLVTVIGRPNNVLNGMGHGANTAPRASSVSNSAPYSSSEGQKIAGSALDRCNRRYYREPISE